MTLADLVGGLCLLNGKVWSVYADPNKPGMAYLRRETKVKGAKHPSGYRYCHLRRVERWLPLTTPATPAPPGSSNKAVL